MIYFIVAAVSGIVFFALGWKLGMTQAWSSAIEKLRVVEERLKREKRENLEFVDKVDDFSIRMLEKQNSSGEMLEIIEKHTQEIQALVADHIGRLEQAETKLGVVTGERNQMQKDLQHLTRKHF